MKQREEQERIDREAATWLVRLDDDRDAPAVRADFARWLAASPAHRAAWDDMRALAGKISAARHGSLAQPLPERIRPAQRSRRSFAIVSTLVAASLLAVIGPDLRLGLAAREVAPTGEVRIVTLPDGSRATLAPGATIAFTATAGERRLSLVRGTVYLDVAHDTHHPFRVETDSAQVRVLGTAFEVTAGDRTQVAVARGLVQVADHDGHDLARLRPGDMLALAPGDAPQRSRIRVDRIAPWREGRMIVNDRPVGEVIAALRPWYRGYIVTRGDGVSRRRVTGVYDLRHPDAALLALGRAQPLTIARVTPWLRIVTVD